MAREDQDDVSAALGEFAAADEPLARLAAARRIRDLADQLERDTVRTARESGVSWSKIGAVYGLTKQGAQQRFAKVRAEQASEQREGAE